VATSARFVARTSGLTRTASCSSRVMSVGFLSVGRAMSTRDEKEISRVRSAILVTSVTEVICLLWNSLKFMLNLDVLGKFIIIHVEFFKSSKFYVESAWFQQYYSQLNLQVC
jgi:hypothetical protein